MPLDTVCPFYSPGTIWFIVSLSTSNIPAFRNVEQEWARFAHDHPGIHRRERHFSCIHCNGSPPSVRSVYRRIVPFCCAHQLATGNAQFIEILNFKACSVDIRPKLILGIWAAQIAFDVYALVLVFLNAMDKPRVQGQKIWKMLYEDGIFLITVSPMSVNPGLYLLHTLPSISQITFSKITWPFIWIETYFLSVLRLLNLILCSLDKVGFGVLCG